MTTYLVFKTAHFVGLLLWTSGFFVWVKSIKIFAALEAEGKLERATVLPTLKPVHIFALHLGMGITLLGGFGMLGMNPEIAKGGWIHAKLALIAVLIALTIMMTRKSKAIAAGAPIEMNSFYCSAGKILVVIVILAVFRPF